MKIKLLFLLFTSIAFSQIPAYYSGINFNLTGNALKYELENLIQVTHTTKIPYSSNTTTDVWDALQAGDLNPNNSGIVYLIYGFNDFDVDTVNDRNRNVASICSGISNCTNYWNREHCYAKSLGTPALNDGGTSDAGEDAHHIRASDVAFNAQRGNRLYGDGEGNAGPVGSFWYPGDEWKGDVARMMMYMYVRYPSQCLAVNVGSGTTTYNVDMPDIFLEWNEEDPVSDFERTRNNVIQSIQGNRNPFIDNPYLATLIWNGPQAVDSWDTLSCPNTTTWNGSVWSNGVPNKGIKAIMNDDFTSTGNIDFCSLTVNGSAQVLLKTNHTFTVVRGITVASTADFTVENNANLIQINNSVNSGNITIMKTSAPIVRLDYTSWSSPVNNQNLLAFSPQTVTNRFYEYNPSGTTSTSAYSVVNPVTNSFVPGKGYIIRAPNNWSSSTASAYNGQFIGVPNNGTFSLPVLNGFNMLGNPYPATIEGKHFIESNRTIETLYFWTHEATATGGSYLQNNFASYTTLGGVAAVPGGKIPDGSIKPGQGFYVNSIENETVLFHNALRYDIKNTQFFRNINSIDEANLFRLNFTNESNGINQILIGYTQKATLGYDPGIDGKVFHELESMLYTTMNEDKFLINGRPAFEITDEVPLSISSNIEGLFTIGLENVSGIFNSQNIYLKDNLLQKTINLKDNPYTFYTNQGTISDRFKIVYQIKDNESNNEISETIVYTKGNTININATQELSLITIFDVKGSVLLQEKVQDNNWTSSLITKRNQVLLIEIQYKDNSKSIKKVIH